MPGNTKRGLSAEGLRASTTIAKRNRCNGDSIRFKSRFRNLELKMLCAVLDVNHQPGTVDASFRPNPIFPVGVLPLLVESNGRRATGPGPRVMWVSGRQELALNATPRHRLVFVVKGWLSRREFV